MNRENIIERLEIMQGNGNFNGEPEENIDFRNCTDSELEWYEKEWIRRREDRHKIRGGR